MKGARNIVNKKSFLESANGAIMERADYELNRIFDNIMDPNTRAAKKRKMTLTVELLPSDDRSHISFSCLVASKLEPPAPIIGMYGVLADSSGEVMLQELTAEIPGQQNLLGNEQIEPAIIQLHKQA